ncbi:scopoletin glucosyltransferase-like [Pyrus ussuriensis x Pyrus communis]|uniref:Scopoletin glucosyltransferase-like n=1 Tax=Pyrus ussuriensis x Pyrus communis TaxID=2448454 RepID=A0A5N5I9V7_9ROSA|nr:scopoletin glucosyltransferase-like [Pyrus ussuriensis x Pyrus communis]
MVPISDMAKLFASQGLKTTIVITPLNAPIFSKAMSSKTYSGSVEVKIKTIKLSSVEAGLPEGCENLDSLPSPELSTNFLKATSLLQESLEQLLLEENLSCLVADMLFPWATDAAAKFDIPRLIFHVTSLFSMAASDIVRNMSVQEHFVGFGPFRDSGFSW